MVKGSYRVFGNDGTHELNEPIANGGGTPTEVLLALASISDHLPVVSGFTIAEVLVGDIDGDGTVAFADFLILAHNFGMPGNACQGDVSGDAKIDFDDFLLLADNFGKKLEAAATSVAEPAGSVLLLMGFVGLLRRSRR